MDVASLARSALALRSAAAHQQQAVAAVQQAHEAEQALVRMLAEATANASPPAHRGQNLDITV